MTPYQRGNRDGLLAVAKELDTRAAGHRAYADKIGPMVPLGTVRWTLRNLSLHWESALRESAALCRLKAEALPDDPEEKPTPRSCDWPGCDHCGAHCPSFPPVFRVPAWMNPAGVEVFVRPGDPGYPKKIQP